jgi:lipopolysaccharide/colanic/teichoic acid biosynthesis glycosyltransferase
MGLLGNSIAASSRGPLTFSQRIRHERLKAAMDAVGSLVLIVLLAPVFLTISVLVLMMNGKPLIYRRRVIGPSGEFDAFKFRTMQRNADRMLESDEILYQAFQENYKLKLDPRVTRLGAILRKFSLDELPQLFNVLMRQMSLVGPRMITAAELEKYGEYQDLLLTVKPGLTGYWQVYGRQEVSYSERVHMDVEYISNWTAWLDIKLLFLTPLRVIRGKGAY